MPWIVSQFIAGLMFMLRSRLGMLIAGALGWLGLSLATYELVVDPFIDQLETYAQNSVSAGGEFGAAMAAWVGFMNFDKALTMIISAYAAKHAVGAGKVFLKKKMA